jgi:hypothetical protein
MASITRCINGNIPNPGGMIMSDIAEIKAYMKQIEKELGDIENNLKKSIIQEIEGHLTEKIQQSRKTNNGEITKNEIEKILTDFGTPNEIALEYQRQLSEEIQPTHDNRRSARKRFLLPISAIVIIILLLMVNFTSPVEDPDDNIIYEGKGLNSIQIGDNLDDIIDQYGEPEYRSDSDDLIWVSYIGEYGLDFLLIKESEVIIEIRFNPAFRGGLSNGISIGSNLDDVLNESGGAKITVQANYSETQGVTLGTDRVLYEQIIDGNITSYKFIDAEKGILYWFNLDRKLTQIVVFKP